MLAWPRRPLGPPLPDPLPAGERLDRRFALMLERTAAARHVSWPLLLAILRTRGHKGAVPASNSELRGLADRLRALDAGRHPRGAAFALAGPGSFADSPEDFHLLPGATAVDRVLALAGYNRAVGLRGLVRGLNAVKPRLIERVLSSDRLHIYAGGRQDVEGRRIDVRVLVLMLYLVHRHRDVTVSCLMTGHGFFTSSGNVSAHSYGRAVDIGALGGVPIVGHQAPGGVTERALRNILLLPEELAPKQLISLFDLGGPSFAMADHADHIHVGY